MTDTLCVILGGGTGERLYPLTKERSKPAVPLAGKYRLIDIPISNCLNSELNKIYVLTQFNSESLNKHIARTFKLDRFSGGFVEIMAAEQSSDSADWFQGTADAVRQCLKHFDDPMIKRILILSGDQLYKFNFRDMMHFHIENQSQITIACSPIKTDEISHYGIAGIYDNSKITKFVEKPKKANNIEDIKITSGGQDAYLASMGVYLFEKDILAEVLESTDKVDFGREIIPEVFKTHKTHGFIYEGYWKDIGTMKAFYEANLMLTDPIPQVDMFDEHWPFFTRPRNLPPAKINASRIEASMISDGSIIDEAHISRSIIGLRGRICRDSKVEGSIIMGCDYYETLEDMQNNEKKNIPSMGIGKNCHIKGAIIDKNARIGHNVKIINKKNLSYDDGDNALIREGIVIIPKGAVIPNNTII